MVLSPASPPLYCSPRNVRTQRQKSYSPLFSFGSAFQITNSALPPAWGHTSEVRCLPLEGHVLVLHRAKDDPESSSLSVSLPRFQDKRFILFPQGQPSCPLTLLLQWLWLSLLDQPTGIDFLSCAYRGARYLGSCVSFRQTFNCNGNLTVVMNTNEAWAVGTFKVFQPCG